VYARLKDMISDWGLAIGIDFRLGKADFDPNHRVVVSPRRATPNSQRQT